MVPCHHVTVANLHLIQITIQIQIQYKVKIQILKKFQGVANNPWIFFMLGTTSFGLPECPWKLFSGLTAFKIGIFNFYKWLDTFFSLHTFCFHLIILC